MERVRSVFPPLPFTNSSREQEIAEGKMLIDAAKAAGVGRIVWSGMPYCSKLSGGKITNLLHNDGKAVVTEYARQCGVPFVDVMAGHYASNLFNNPASLKFFVGQDDGSFAIPWPVKPTTVLPVIDAVSDYGLWVRHVV